MPASARQAEKGSAALAVPASLPCSLLLLRLVEPAKELARLPYLFPGRIDWSSPDKSVASSAEFRERAPFLARKKLQYRKVPCDDLRGYYGADLRGAEPTLFLVATGHV